MQQKPLLKRPLPLNLPPTGTGVAAEEARERGEAAVAPLVAATQTLPPRRERVGRWCCPSRRPSLRRKSPTGERWRWTAPSWRGTLKSRRLWRRARHHRRGNPEEGKRAPQNRVSFPRGMQCLGETETCAQERRRQRWRRPLQSSRWSIERMMRTLRRSRCRCCCSHGDTAWSWRRERASREQHVRSRYCCYCGCYWCNHFLWMLLSCGRSGTPLPPTMPRGPWRRSRSRDEAATMSCCRCGGPLCLRMPPPG